MVDQVAIDTQRVDVSKLKQSLADDSDLDNDTLEDAAGPDAVKPEDDIPLAASPVRSLTGPNGAGIAGTSGAAAVSIDGTIDNAQGDGGASAATATSQPTSPKAKENRVSVSSLANVELDENTANANAGPETESEPVKPELPARASLKTSWLGGSSTSASSVPPPPPKDKAQPGLPRKLTGPFSWLSRNSTKDPSPPAPRNPSTGTANGRRNTASSVSTIQTNPDLMLNKLDEGSEGANVTRQPARNSLRDRFKMLRLREEAGITLGGEGEEPSAQPNLAGRGRKESISLAVVSPSGDGKPSPGTPAAFDPALAPGTAVGVTAGPPAHEEVDWDLWQSVVNEGPAAVARSSPEELNAAIASGIPTAIRGVVWQVLAQSKNEELESVYRDLVSRGTEQDRDRASMSSGTQSLVSSSNKEKETTSSASSVHSESSSGIAKSASPTERDPESAAKAQAAALAERKRKAKEDAASLQKLEKAIKRDLGARTSFSKFAASAGLQDGLFGVCKAYALFDQDVGYAQGMNFLAMPLLFNMPEEEAFCLLVRLMNQYHLRDLFIADMPGLHKHLYQFERLLEDFEPALYCHLHRKQVTPHLYATQWFLTLFAYRFPLQLVLRIYDLILSEGLEAILKFGIVLMQKNAAKLLGMNDMMQLTNFLKDRLFDVYIDQAPSAGSILESGFFGSSGASIDKEVYRADMLVQDACAVKITPTMIAAYTAEWEEKTRLEKEREAELENLKSTNATLTLKVRRLEERVQEHDQEHAALATELVRTKVENEELLDRNESLKTQVEELRVVVDKQPQEVEERLQSEMDRLMKRNQEVHEENTKLEEEMAEMERQLVETKMAYAEVQSNHDSLQRRLNELRKAIEA